MDLASWDMETIKSNVCCYFIGRALKQSCYVSWLVLVCGQARSVLAKKAGLHYPPIQAVFM